MTAERLKEKELLEIFYSKEAILKGHFLLSSGLHSNGYVQCALVLQYPDIALQLGKELAHYFRDFSVDVVVGPALGGIIVAHEVARALGVKALFTERNNGVMILRRGFSLKKTERVLVVEDVVTTGGSTREVVEVVREEGAEVVGVGALIDRSHMPLDFGAPFFSLLKLEIKNYEAADCPLCQEGIPLIKPGSKKR